MALFICISHNSNAIYDTSGNVANGGIWEMS